MSKKISLLFIFLLLTSILQAKCSNERLSLTLPDNTTLRQAVNIIAKECQYSIIYNNDETRNIVNRKVLSPVDVYRKSSDYILDILISRNNLHYTIENDILTISHVLTKIFKVDYIDSSRIGNSNTDVVISGSSAGTGSSVSSSTSSSEGSSSGSAGATITTKESFDFWQDLSNSLKEIINRPEDGIEGQKSSIVINKKSGQVIASGTKRQLDRVEKYLDELLESLRKQVVIDIKIVSVTLDKSNSIGINWSNFSMDFGLTGTLNKTLSDITGETKDKGTVPVTGGSFVINRDAGLDMSGFFNFLRAHGETKSLSNPKILAINNQPSMISVGDNINYLIKESTITAGTEAQISSSETPASLFVGVLLDITPQIDDDGFITLRINPSISEFKYTADAVKQEAARTLPPDTVSRRISSVVRIKDGDSIILGGLINSTKGEVENKVPFLGDVPYLGRLFKSTVTTDVVTEIVFVLTPHMANAGEVQSLDELGFNAIAENTDIDKVVIKKSAMDTTSKKRVAPKLKKINTRDETDDYDTIPYVEDGE